MGPRTLLPTDFDENRSANAEKHRDQGTTALAALGWSPTRAQRPPRRTNATQSASAPYWQRKTPYDGRQGMKMACRATTAWHTVLRTITRGDTPRGVRPRPPAHRPVSDSSPCIVDRTCIIGVARVSDQVKRDAGVVTGESPHADGLFVLVHLMRGDARTMRVSSVSSRLARWSRPAAVGRCWLACTMHAQTCARGPVFQR